MKLNTVVELFVKFGFASEYVVDSISAQDPATAFERLKMEMFIRWDEMGRPKDLEEDCDRINRLKLTSVTREGEKKEAEKPTLSADDFRRISARIAGDINMACDDMIEGFLGEMSEEQKEFIMGALKKKECGGCKD